jgi:hypothetical protein
MPINHKSKFEKGEPWHLFRLRAQMSTRNALLMCPNGHDHIIGKGQMYLEHTLCIWCGGLLVLKARGWR